MMLTSRDRNRLALDAMMKLFQPEKPGFLEKQAVAEIWRRFNNEATDKQMEQAEIEIRKIYQL